MCVGEHSPSPGVSLAAQIPWEEGEEGQGAGVGGRCGAPDTSSARPTEAPSLACSRAVREVESGMRNEAINDDNDGALPLPGGR